MKHKQTPGAKAPEKGQSDMFELIVIWYTGEKEVFAYTTREDAEKSAHGFKTAFGNQIEWTGVRERRIW